MHLTTKNIALLSSIVLWLMPTMAFSSVPSSAVASEKVSDAPVHVSDTAQYAPYTYIRFLRDNEQAPKFTDEEFFDIAGRVIFPVSDSSLPQNDSLILQLQREVFPLINKDSLELASVIIRGAASPEGSTRFNKTLGEQRAATLLQFLRDNLERPINEEVFNMDMETEDYRTLCIMMRRAGDKDYPVVQALCDRYLPEGETEALKRQLQTTRQGVLWRHLLSQYFPRLRAARVLFFFKAPRTYEKQVIPEVPPTPEVVEAEVLPADTVAVLPAELKRPRREILSVKSNLLFDVAYVPGYNRWCPIPNVAIEYYPLRGHFTFGFSFDCPWWQHYDDHKFFQIRNYQLESRYYFRSGSIENNPPGEGAAFRGLYVQAYGHLGLFGICFDANRGWVGEGLGAGVGVGYVMPLSKKGHWRLEFGLQAGFFACKYDPYQYESPVDTDPHDNLYYYKYYGDPSLFKKRQHRFTWIGPTRIGITLSYDLLYRRIEKKGSSFIPWEKVKK